MFLNALPTNIGLNFLLITFLLIQSLNCYVVGYLSSIYNISNSSSIEAKVSNNYFYNYLIVVSYCIEGCWYSRILP